MAVSMIGPKFYAWDKDGKPLAGGLVYTYQARTNIPKPTYQSEDGITANSNPVELNSAGYADIYLDGAYKIVVKDKSGKEIWTEDPVTAQGQTTSEWLPAQSLTFVDADTFTVAGNQTEFFTAGRGLRLKGDNYLYAQVVDATYSGGNTFVNVDSESALTADLATASLSVITNESRYDRFALKDAVVWYPTLADLLAETRLKVGNLVGALGRNARGDGGGNVFEFVAAGTGTHDNGRYINHANSGGQLLGLFNDGRCNPLQFGATLNGSTDDGAAMQAASDYAESAGLVFELLPAWSGLITLKRNWYLGDLTLRTNGTTINIVSDGSFTQVGTAINKGEGVILTKSALGASYGATAVTIVFDVLKIHFSRPTNGVGPKTAVLLENVDGFTGLAYLATTEDQDSAKNVLDLYGGCQNVDIGSINAVIRNQTRSESLWIRNHSDSRATKNVNIGSLFIDLVGNDEAIAIFNFSLSGSTAPEVKNVNIGSSVINCAYRGQGITVEDTVGTGLVDAIHFVDVEINSFPNNGEGFGFRTDSCRADVGSLKITTNVLSGITNAYFMARHEGTAPVSPTYIGRLEAVVTGNAGSGDVYCTFGPLDIGLLFTRTENSAEITHLSTGAHRIGGGEMLGDVASVAVRNCPEVRGTVSGRMEGILNFYGAQICDTDRHNNAIWFIQSGATLAPTAEVSYVGEAQIIGSGTIDKIISAYATHGNDIALRANYTLKNLGDLTIAADGNGQSFKLVEYNNVHIQSTGVTRRTLTLAV